MEIDRSVDLDFMIVGAGKSGTTTLADYLDLHGNVCLSDPKEPQFFDNRSYQNGKAWYLKTYFSGCRVGQIKGEASVHNLLLPYVPPRIKDTFPSVRLVALLRDPVERAYSDWWMKYSWGVEDRDFDTAIKADLDRLSKGEDFSDEAQWQARIEAYQQYGVVHSGVYVDCGHYADQLQRYFTLFRKEQFRVVISEDLFERPEEILPQLARFVGVTDPVSVSPNSLIWSNSAVGQKMATLQRFNWKFGRYAPAVVRRATRRALGKVWKHDRRPPMPEGTRLLLQRYYGLEIEKLEATLGRDLTIWKGGR